MKTVVTGVNGLLGHQVFRALQARWPGTLGTIRGHADAAVPGLTPENVVPGFDALDMDHVRAELRRIQPAVVVNCIGIVKQRAAAHDAVTSITVNSLLPHVIAETCAEWGGRLIHVSTDCVFGGARGNYTELDVPDAVDLYGRTKALGEVTTDNALTLRTSFIGRELVHRDSLLEWFLAHGGGTVRGFTRAIYAGVTSNHLASLIAGLVADHPSLNGLYQVAARPISKCELLRLVRDAFKLRIEIVPDDSFVCDRSMSAEKLSRAIGYHAPEWPELIAELAADPVRR